MTIPGALLDLEKKKKIDDISSSKVTNGRLETEKPLLVPVLFFPFEVRRPLMRLFWGDCGTLLRQIGDRSSLKVIKRGKESKKSLSLSLSFPRK